jgi:hypothetical protein
MRKDYPTLVHHTGKNQLPQYTVWLKFDDNDFPNFNVELLSPLPENSWMEHEVNDVGAEGLLGESNWHYVDDVNIGLVTYAIKHGLSIRQPFAIRTAFYATRDFEGEYNAWIESELITTEPVKTKIIAQRYARWINDFINSKNY